MKLVTFYEVADSKGETEFGDSSPAKAIEWFRKGLDKKVYASVWNEETEDFQLVTDKIDVTPLIQATIMSERERA